MLSLSRLNRFPVSWGDLTTRRGVRVGGIVLVTLAFVAGAIISSVDNRER